MLRSDYRIRADTKLISYDSAFLLASPDLTKIGLYSAGLCLDEFSAFLITAMSVIGINVSWGY